MHSITAHTHSRGKNKAAARCIQERKYIRESECTLKINSMQLHVRFCNALRIYGAEESEADEELEHTNTHIRAQKMHFTAADGLFSACDDYNLLVQNSNHYSKSLCNTLYTKKLFLVRIEPKFQCHPTVYSNECPLLRRISFHPIPSNKNQMCIFFHQREKGIKQACMEIKKDKNGCCNNTS
jgi:hypothetical protein